MEIQLNINAKSVDEFHQALQSILAGSNGVAPKPTRKPKPAEASSEQPAESESPAGDDFVETKELPATNGHAANNGTDVSDKANGALTVEQVRAVVQTKNEAGKRDSVRALLTKFGTPSVTKMDPAKYAEFFQEVSAL